jgi:hypothetical protein
VVEMAGFGREKEVAGILSKKRSTIGSKTQQRCSSGGYAVKQTYRKESKWVGEEAQPTATANRCAQTMRKRGGKNWECDSASGVH